MNYGSKLFLEINIYQNPPLLPDVGKPPDERWLLCRACADQVKGYRYQEYYSFPPKLQLSSASLILSTPAFQKGR